MSIKCMSWVLEHSEACLSERLVLLALAEYAHDDGGMAFPSVNTLARKARIGESTCRKALRALEADGSIEQQGTTKYGTIIYRVVMKPQGGPDSEGGPDTEGGQNRAIGGQNRAKGGQDLAPIRQEPSGTANSESARARARDEVPKISGRKVNAASWELTEQVLTEYNRLAGSKLRLLTSANEPSEAAKRIYGRVRAYPDITLAEFADIIERTLSSQWWGKNPPTIGVVFGPKVFEENITRSPHRVDTDKQERDKRRMQAMARLMEGTE